MKKLVGYLYIIHVREFLDRKIYKIGRTRDIIKRISQYPKGSKCILFIKCEEHILLETTVIKIFNEKFIQKIEIGTEYYEGDIEEMKKEMISITNEYVVNEDIHINNNVNDEIINKLNDIINDKFENMIKDKIIDKINDEIDNKINKVFNNKIKENAENDMKNKKIIIVENKCHDIDSIDMKHDKKKRHICHKCKREFKQLGHLRDHLNKQTPCDALTIKKTLHILQKIKFS
jgi:hypothetical protein